MHNAFKPAWWLPNPHLQTLWPSLFRSDIAHLALEKERLELPDGDFIDLVWLGKDQSPQPLVIILHGFEGSIDSHYAKGMMLALQNHGWRSVFMHFRGCSGEPNRLQRGYHSGETGDLDYLVKVLRAREPETALAAVGFSLGGNVLLKWIGETAQRNPLKAAAAISVPFDLNKAVLRIQRGFSRFYQWYFLKCLRERLMHKFQFVSPHIEPVSLLKTNSMQDFDDLYTAPLHGFTDATEYYTAASSRYYLRSIQTPTLILHAKDDPFMTEDVIPLHHELSSSIHLEVTDSGGHVGFVTGNHPLAPEYWQEQRIPLFFKEILKEHCK